MTHDELRVLQALEWSERTAHCAALPIRQIAVATLGGNDDLAARVLADLDVAGCVSTDFAGWSSGSLTSKGRVALLSTTVS